MRSVAFSACLFAVIFGFSALIAMLLERNNIGVLSILASIFACLVAMIGLCLVNKQVVNTQIANPEKASPRDSNELSDSLVKKLELSAKPLVDFSDDSKQEVPSTNTQALPIPSHDPHSVEESNILQTKDAIAVQPTSLSEKVLKPAEYADDTWQNLVQECIDLLETLERHQEQPIDGRELNDYITSQLIEILQRNQVEIVDSDSEYNLLRHQVLPPGSKAEPGAKIARTVSPGFAIGRRVLRRAKVELA